MNQAPKQQPDSDRRFIYGACIFGLAIPIVLLCAIFFHKRQLASDEKTYQQARQQEAYQTGFEAHERGLDISNAPNDQKDIWVAGWNTAEGTANRKKAELEARNRTDTQPQMPERAEAAQHPTGDTVIFVFALLFYFLPALNAGLRGHQNFAAISILNLLLGWTILGWVAALVWSFTVVDRRG